MRNIGKSVEKILQGFLYNQGLLYAVLLCMHITQRNSRVGEVRSLVISVFLYACESWIINAEMEKRINAFELNCYRPLLNIH